MNRTLTRRGSTLIVVSITAMLVVAFSLAVYLTQTGTGELFATTLCGNGSAPDYGFTYELQQAHWTVAWQDYAAEETVSAVDAILDRLNEDSIAQTMILIQPPAQVGNRVNCAVHFLRYMQLGLATGERKDNGFVFLIVVEPTSIDVHYGVGLGLPALTAPELTALNRAAEASYQATNSIDEALLTLVQGFDTVARNKYPPLVVATSDPESINLPAAVGSLGIFGLCGLSCMGLVLLLFVVWLFMQFARKGISFNTPGASFRGIGSPFSGGRSSGGGSSFGGGGGGHSAPTRGGGGSGRAGRGN